MEVRRCFGYFGKNKNIFFLENGFGDSLDPPYIDNQLEQDQNDDYYNENSLDYQVDWNENYHSDDAYEQWNE